MTQGNHRLWIVALLAGVILQVVAIPTISAQTSCDLVNQQEQMKVYFAPMTSDTQLKQILPQGTPYTLLDFVNGSYLIEYGEGQRGWVDFHTRILNGTCPDTPLEGDAIPLSDFPTICFYTFDETLPVFGDAILSQQRGSETIPAGRHPIEYKTDVAVAVYGSAERSGGFVSPKFGTFSGHCEGTIQLATALDGARVWSEPSIATGEVIATLESGSLVGVTEVGVEGEIQVGVMGTWHKIVQGDGVGWVWSERLQLREIFTAPQPVLGRATALDDARIWSQPDVTTGEVILTLLPDQSVNLIGDPQEGRIRLDTDEIGTWYPVQQGGIVGWVYAERLHVIS